MASQPVITAAARQYSPALALIVASAIFMQNLDSAIINTSLPQMARSFGVVPINMSLGITAYMLAAAAMSPVANWLSDRYGARNVLLGAVLGFTFSSVWCALSGSLSMFIIARVVQGMGGALMMPVGMAVVVRHLSKPDLVRANALTIWPALLAPIIGPVLGGFITQNIDWRWNFWLNLPLGLAGAAAVQLLMPNDKSEVPRSLDITGLTLCTLGLPCLLAGFQFSATEGAERLMAVGLILVGIAAGYAALRHLRRHPTPLLSLVPLSRESLRYAFHPGALFRAIFSTAPFLLPLMFQLGFGLSPAAAGGWVMIYFFGNLGIKPAVTWLFRYFGFRHLLLGNGLLVAVSLLVCAFMTPHTPSVILGFMLLFAGCTRSVQLTGLTAMAFADVPNSERGAASNLMSMMQQTAQAAGVAIGAFCLSLFQAWYGARLVGLPEIHAAFIVAAVLSFLGSLVFLRMPRNFGDELTGRS